MICLKSSSSAMCITEFTTDPEHLQSHHQEYTQQEWGESHHINCALNLGKQFRLKQKNPKFYVHLCLNHCKSFVEK